VKTPQNTHPYGSPTKNLNIIVCDQSKSYEYNKHESYNKPIFGGDDHSVFTSPNLSQIVQQHPIINTTRASKQNIKNKENKNFQIVIYIIQKESGTNSTDEIDTIIVNNCKSINAKIPCFLFIIHEPPLHE
jgi:hypothetical protein